MKTRRYRLFRVGNLLAIQAAIGGKPDIPPLPVRLIVDTGAAYTIFHPDILKEIGCDLGHPIREVPLLTMNGIVTAPVVNVPWFHCLGQRISPWTVVAYPPPAGFIRYGVGLLGMDFLARFGAVIHIGRGEIWLEGETETK